MRMLILIDGIQCLFKACGGWKFEEYYCEGFDLTYMTLTLELAIGIS